MNRTHKALRLCSAYVVRMRSKAASLTSSQARSSSTTFSKKSAMVSAAASPCAAQQIQQVYESGPNSALSAGMVLLECTEGCLQLCTLAGRLHTPRWARGAACMLGHCRTWKALGCPDDRLLDQL